jgi:superfamily II DNA helicase RecQ
VTNTNLTTITDKLYMTQATMIRLPIYRPNLYYEVRKRPGDSATNRWSHLRPLIEEIKTGVCPLTIVICKTITMEEAVYHHLLRELGEAAYVEGGVYDYRQCRVLRQHSRSSSEVKDHFENVFVKNTVENMAFVGVFTPLAAHGLNFKGARRVIGLGAPGSQEILEQIGGRVGRDGLPASAFFFIGGSDFSGGMSTNDVRKFWEARLENIECLRVKSLAVLGEELPVPHAASNFCCKSCYSRLVDTIVKLNINSAAQRALWAQTQDMEPTDIHVQEASDLVHEEEELFGAGDEFSVWEGVPEWGGLARDEETNILLDILIPMPSHYLQLDVLEQKEITQVVGRDDGLTNTLRQQLTSRAEEIMSATPDLVSSADKLLNRPPVSHLLPAGVVSSLCLRFQEGHTMSGYAFQSDETRAIVQAVVLNIDREAW